MKRRKMNPVNMFPIQNLPDVPFRRVLYFLSFKDTRKLRCLSKWFERRITFLRKSIFNTYNLHGFNRNIDEDNCKKTSVALSVAMAKPHAPVKLNIQFCGKLNRTMRQISVDFKGKITSLCINVFDNENLLLQPGFQFECLESLTLDGFGCSDDNMVKAYEAMLDKNAKNLENLTIKWLKINLRVPDLPKLDFLCLLHVDEKASWSILEQSRPTITTLELSFNDMEPQPSLNNDESNNSEFYQFPSIKHLTVFEVFNFKFVVFNAETLVSLMLLDIEEGILEDVVWPNFPKLRELSIDNPRYLSILLNCKETLERLDMSSFVYNSDYVYDDTYDYDDVFANLKIPRLTDLYVLEGSHEFTSKFISSNHKSLEFLYLSDMDIPDLDAGARMERMGNIVLGYSSSEDPENYFTANDKNRMALRCPNAEVFLVRKKNMGEIKDLVESRSKRKNFSMNVTYI